MARRGGVPPRLIVCIAAACTLFLFLAPVPVHAGKGSGGITENLHVLNNPLCILHEALVVIDMGVRVVDDQQQRTMRIAGGSTNCAPFVCQRCVAPGLRSRCCWATTRSSLQCTDFMSGV